MYLVSHGHTLHGQRTAKHRHMYSEPDLTRTPLRARRQIIIRVPNPVEAMSSAVSSCVIQAREPHHASAAAAARSALLPLPTRTAKRRVGRHALSRLTNRLDEREAALEEEVHDQAVGLDAAPE